MEIWLAPERVIIDGKEYEYPNKRVKGHTIVQVDDKIFLDGYEFRDGRWKITIRSIFETLIAWG